jgi:hypothetical protein
MSRVSRKGLWRTGRKIGRTIYLMVGEVPSDDDVLIGVMDTPQLARQAVVSVNHRAIANRLEALDQ